MDAVKLAQGKPAFTADVEMRGMLVGKILHSPIAHGRIKHIDASQARALPGVHAVLTYQDVPRVVALAPPASPTRSPARSTSSAWTARCATWATAWPRWPPRPRRSPSARWP